MMRRFCFTISQWMAATAALGLNIAWVRAYLLAEMSGDANLFDFGFLIFFALQLGLWRYLRTVGGRRRFWLGFEVCGLSATLALLILFDMNMDLFNWYTGAASDLSYFCLPAQVDAILSNTHWDWFLAIVFFLPEFLAAVLGGLVAAYVFKRPSGQRRAVGSARFDRVASTGVRVAMTTPFVNEESRHH
jgi:hypothetical protein